LPLLVENSSTNNYNLLCARQRKPDSSITTIFCILLTLSPVINFIHFYAIKIWDAEVVEQVHQTDVKAMEVAAREAATV